VGWGVGNHQAAVNGQVNTALLSSDTAIINGAADDLAIAGDDLKAELANVKSAGVSREAEAAVDAMGPAVDSYIAAGKAVVLAKERKEPTAALEADVRTEFSQLEANLPSVTDAVQAEVTLTTKSAETGSDSSEALSLLIFSGAAALLSVFAWLTAKNEVGKMAASLNSSLDSIGGALSEIGHHSSPLAAASEKLTAVSSELASSAQETSLQAGFVSAAASQVSGNVAVVSVGTGEMDLSIREISHGAQDAVAVAEQAARVARLTNDTVAKLGVSSTEIGNVVEVITSIAELTNLLALNATIEAACAGEDPTGRSRSLAPMPSRCRRPRAASGPPPVSRPCEPTISAVSCPFSRPLFRPDPRSSLSTQDRSESTVHGAGRHAVVMTASLCELVEPAEATSG